MPTPKPGPEPKVVYVPRPLYSQPLSVSGSDLRCKYSYIGGGYDRCTLSVDVSYQGHPDVSGDFRVSCEAEAQLTYQDDIIPSRRTFDESGTLYVSSGYGSANIEITVKPTFAVKPLVAVRVSNVSCTYNRY